MGTRFANPSTSASAQIGARAVVEKWTDEALDDGGAPDRLVSAWGLSHLQARELIGSVKTRRRIAAAMGK